MQQWEPIPFFYIVKFTKKTKSLPQILTKDDQKRFNIKLIGGDLTSSMKHINITITIFGETENKKSIPRNGSKIGDFLYVSGILGLSKIGLDNYNSNNKELSIAKNKYLLPEPRVELGMSLNKIANSMIDISDGLVQDATHLAKNSNLSIELDLSKIPIPKFKTFKQKNILDSALYGGDDYELLFSCNPLKKNFTKLAIKQNITLTKIGVFKTLKNEFLTF